MGKKIFTPIVYIQNDDHWDHFEVCMLGYPLTPPPPRGARRLTARPANPQGLGQPRPPPPPSLGGGWGSSPPLQPPKWLHTPWGHTLPGSSPRGMRFILLACSQKCCPIDITGHLHYDQEGRIWCPAPLLCVCSFRVIPLLSARGRGY